MANIKLVSAIAATAISFSVSVHSNSAVVSDSNKISATVSSSELRIKSFEILPARLKDLSDSSTIADSSPIFEIETSIFDFNPQAEDSAPIFNVAVSKSDSVSAVDTPNKIIHSTVDFDPSDDDIDPDPITVTDSDVKTTTKARADGVSASDSPSLQPDIPQSDSVTSSETVTSKTVGTNPSDSASVSEAVNTKSIGTAPADSVSASESDVKTITPQGKTDSISVSDAPALQPSIVKVDSSTPSDAVNSITVNIVAADSASASESISTILTLGETTMMYPEIVNVSDGTVGFIFTRTESNTGIIGGPGFVGQIIMNDDRITQGDSSNAGLVVNYIYTEVDDSSLGGHMCNATPLSAGAKT